MVVIRLYYRNVINQHIFHLKLTQCFMSVISHQSWAVGISQLTRVVERWLESRSVSRVLPPHQAAGSVGELPGTRVVWVMCQWLTPVCTMSGPNIPQSQVFRDVLLNFSSFYIYFIHFCISETLAHGTSSYLNVDGAFLGTSHRSYSEWNWNCRKRRQYWQSQILPKSVGTWRGRQSRRSSSVKEPKAWVSWLPAPVTSSSSSWQAQVLLWFHQRCSMSLFFCLCCSSPPLTWRSLVPSCLTVTYCFSGFSSGICCCVDGPLFDLLGRSSPFLLSASFEFVSVLLLGSVKHYIIFTIHTSGLLYLL